MRIILGVTGGIAAYKAVLLLRLLREAGHSVQVVPTHSALKFVGKPTWEALSGQPVHTSVFDDVVGVEHVQLGQTAELIIVAPATADFLARVAAGRADDLLTATILVAECPKVFAPAMHTQMWENLATGANVATLKARGIQFIGPAEGRLTGQDTGIGRMTEPEEIFHVLFPRASDSVLPNGPQNDGYFAPSAPTSPRHSAAFYPSPRHSAAFEEGSQNPGNTSHLAADTATPHVVITAGGTREAIDPVRFVGNRSSGKQGIALAQAAAAQGAKVTLIAANIDKHELEAVKDIAEIIEVESAHQMKDAVENLADQADVIIMAAAVADFRPISIAESKVKKGPDHKLIVEMVENPDILKGLCENKRPGQIIVGFAAETGDENNSVLDYGRQKARKKGTDLLAVNQVGNDKGFGAVDNEVWLLDKDGNEVGHAQGTKRQVADAIIETVILREVAESRNRTVA